MGKKKAPTRLSPSSPGTLAVIDSVNEELSKIKAEGSKQFTKKEYAKAADMYEKALRTLAGTPEAKEERALLHSHKAACFLMQHRFKEAVNECTSALEASPGYGKALVRRAKAYESMGHYKQALSDIQKANRSDSTSPENLDTEKRLKDIVSGKRAGTIVSTTANGALNRRGGFKGRHPLFFLAKVSLGDEVRQLHLMANATYAELLEAARLKFPQAPPFAIKYVDREGDLITIVDKVDLGKAMAEVCEAAERVSGGSHGPRLPSQGMLPALRLTLQPVASPEDVPKPPAEELAALEQSSAARRLLRAQANPEPQQANGAKEQVAQEVEVEPWVMDFAALFREQLGVDHDRPLDLQAHAWEQLQSALDMAVRDERSLPLFDKAAARFQEMSAQGMLQWGNVMMLKGKRLVDKAVSEGKSVEESVGLAEDFFKQAEEKYEESERLKPGFIDRAAAVANLIFERAKLAAGFVQIQPDLPSSSGEEGGKELVTREATREEQAQTSPAQQEALQQALGRLKAETVKKAAPLFEEAWEHFRRTIDLIPEEERKPMKPVPEGQPPPQDENNMWAHCLVMWGNLLYEYSQILAAVEADWKPVLDKAVSNFRGAGCPEDDITAALRAHTQAAHLDLPPADAAAGKGAAPPTAAQEVEDDTPADAKDVKGLPSLNSKPKKKAAA